MRYTEEIIFSNGTFYSQQDNKLSTIIKLIYHHSSFEFRWNKIPY